MPRIMQGQLSRSRWAALGAALAVSLGAGGFGLIHATSPDGAAAFVPIAPCRLFDTRADFQVGDRGTPLGAAESHTLPGTGAVGECTLPATALGLVLNVTAVGATLPTFLAVYPAGGEVPNASALNPAPGEPPTPNAVTTDLSDDGTFSVYNLQGAVDVFADVVGYYTDHDHDDRYYTKTQSDTALVAKADQAAVDAALAGKATQSDLDKLLQQTAQLAAEFDVRVPEDDSLTISGAAFTPRSGGLEWLGDTAPCARSASPDKGMAAAIPLTPGSTLNGLSVTAFVAAGLTTESFDVDVMSQTAGHQDFVSVHHATQDVTAGDTAVTFDFTLPTPEAVDPGEALSVWLRSTSANKPLVFFCTVEADFSRPG